MTLRRVIQFDSVPAPYIAKWTKASDFNENGAIWITTESHASLEQNIGSGRKTRVLGAGVGSCSSAKRFARKGWPSQKVA